MKKIFRIISKKVPAMCMIVGVSLLAFYFLDGHGFTEDAQIGITVGCTLICLGVLTRGKNKA